MPSEDDARASQLARRALELVNSGQLEDGTRTLREAASISPENADVKASILRIQQDENVPTLLKLCRKLVLKHDENAGIEAQRLLERSDVQISDSTGTECADLLFDYCQSLMAGLCGKIVGRLLRESPGARKCAAARLSDKTAEFFEIVWNLGDDAIQGLIVVLLEASAWMSETTRQNCEERVFELLLTRLAQETEADKTVSIKAISRLMVADSAELHTIFRESSFFAILSLLDIRKPDETRSQATLAASKYLEASQETGQKALFEFTSSKISKGADGDLIAAFSAASALFPILPSVASAMFLTEGFVESLVPLLETNAKNVEIQRAALEMLSAACIDPGCREAIGKACSGWLGDVIELSRDQNAGLAAVVLAKVRGGGEPKKQAKGQKVKEETRGVEELAGVFKGMMIGGDDAAVQRSIEGLAYTSLQPKVKEELANDRPFLKKLFDILSKSSGKSTLTFGGLTILANLTGYLPNLTDEQKRLGQLKAYANTKKATTEPDPLDREDCVTARCKLVLDAGIIPILVGSSKKVSPTSLGLILSILLSLSKHPKNRGQIAQQGGVKLLLQALASVASTNATDTRASTSAAHALARILISTNPTHVFSSSLPISLATRPLLSLLDDEGTEQRDLLPVFESLLALTNLASTDNDTRDLIIRVGWPRIEELLLANNSLIRRAAVELVCNLVASPTGVAKFADGTKQAGNRLHILLALADVEDYETRRAAGGALAMLLEWDAAVRALLERDRGVTILLELCREEKDELRHRGVVCVRNVVCAPGAVGKAGVQKVKSEGGVEVLKGMLRETRNPDVLQIGVEALKSLLQEER
ncbi:hypothetical protein GP486_002171 [Trichoglossum hirsutum]|uniref:UNC-45/Cro1/She4 central domain-containing protein n=1 Tax=Trichoglossum hirsutum TaxID=265104 RepID=A0A9P8LFQ5_9PEZI|nr:hypothetical protein GP486_002171 [Trichoglossum hirsutum]